MERTDVKNNHTEEYSTGQIRCIEKSDPEYPQIMKQYSSMPAKLYVKGRLPDPKRRTVAVIGARMCSPYGRMQAFRYAVGQHFGFGLYFIPHNAGNFISLVLGGVLLAAAQQKQNQ